MAKISAPATLVELLKPRAMTTPQATAYTYLEDGADEERHLTYAELERSARQIAGLLSANGLKGARTLLLFPPVLDYISAFLGCLFAQVIAVPVYPPLSERDQRRLAALWRTPGRRTRRI